MLCTKQEIRNNVQDNCVKRRMDRIISSAEPMIRLRMRESSLHVMPHMLGIGCIGGVRGIESGVVGWYISGGELV